MKNDWMTTSSFERMHEVISAINVLSIHAKLVKAKVIDPTDQADIQRARDRLLTFLGRFQVLIQNAEQGGATVVGADPRLGELALRFLSHKRRLSHRTPLYEMSFDRLRELIKVDNSESLPDLISCLRDLRSLVEQHAYADVVDLLGDV